MDRREVVLAAFAPTEGAILTPVKIQKLLFLIDEEIPELVGGPHFSFRPYDYGPFDPEVYSILSELEYDGLLVKVRDWNWFNYHLSVEGQEKAREIFAALDEKAQEYIAKTVDFVLGLSFSELVSAIYKAYPEMRENSVFEEAD